MIQLFLSQLFIGFLSCLIVYAVGKTISSFYEITGNFFFRLFITNCLGIIAIVFAYSVLGSKGRTISLLLIPFIIYFFYRYRQSVKTFRFHWKEILQESVWVLGLFLIIFLYQSLFFFDFAKNSLLYLFRDDYSHALFSDSLKLWGSENYLTDLLYFNPGMRIQLIPYHYPELWLTSFFAKLFSIATINCYYLITNSLLLSTFLCGICSLYKKTNIFVIVLFAIISLFITNVYSSQIRYLGFHSFPWDGTVMGLCSQKLAFIAVYLLLGIILVLKKQKTDGIIVIAAIPLFSVTFVPGILCGIVLFSLLEIIEAGFRTTRRQGIAIGLAFVFFFVYFLFYRFFQSSYTKNYATFLSFLDSWKLKISFWYFMFHFIGITLFFTPYIILLLRKSLILYRFWIFYIFCLTGGILATLLGSSLLDAGQFTSNSNILAIIILIVSFAMYISEGNWNGKKILIVTLFCMLVLGNTIFVVKTKYELSVSKEPGIENEAFLQSIAQNIQENPSVILYFKTTKGIHNGEFSSWYHSSPIIPLFQYTNKTIIFSIANPESFAQNITMSYVDSNYYQHFTPLGIWYSKGKTQTLESFVKKYSIHYFYAMQGTSIPEYIIKNAKKVLISKTTQSKFYIINLDN